MIIKNAFTLAKKTSTDCLKEDSKKLGRSISTKSIFTRSKTQNSKQPDNFCLLANEDESIIQKSDSNSNIILKPITGKYLLSNEDESVPKQSDSNINITSKQIAGKESDTTVNGHETLSEIHLNRANTNSSRGLLFARTKTQNSKKVESEQQKKPVKLDDEDIIIRQKSQKKNKKPPLNVQDLPLSSSYTWAISRKRTDGKLIDDDMPFEISSMSCDIFIGGSNKPSNGLLLEMDEVTMLTEKKESTKLVIDQLTNDLLIGGKHLETSNKHLSGVLLESGELAMLVDHIESTNLVIDQVSIEDSKISNLETNLTVLDLTNSRKSSIEFDVDKLKPNQQNDFSQPMFSEDHETDMKRLHDFKLLNGSGLDLNKPLVIHQVKGINTVVSSPTHTINSSHNIERPTFIPNKMAGLISKFELLIANSDKITSERQPLKLSEPLAIQNSISRTIYKESENSKTQLIESKQPGVLNFGSNSNQKLIAESTTSTDNGPEDITGLKNRETLGGTKEDHPMTISDMTSGKNEKVDNSQASISKMIPNQLENSATLLNHTEESKQPKPLNSGSKFERMPTNSSMVRPQPKKVVISPSPRTTTLPGIISQLEDCEKSTFKSKTSISTKAASLISKFEKLNANSDIKQGETHQLKKAQALRVRSTATNNNAPDDISELANCETELVNPAGNIITEICKIDLE
jgi:hypothetical protein